MSFRRFGAGCSLELLAHTRPAVHDDGAALADEELACRIVNVEADCQCPRHRIDDTGVVHVMRSKCERIGPAGNFERQALDVPSKRHICGGQQGLQLYLVGPHNSEERRAFVVRSKRC